MIVEHPRELRVKKLLAHGFLIAFIAVILFPFLVVISISLREGNFTNGSLLPDHPTLEHWALAFQAVATGAWWAFLPPTIVLTLISFGLLYLQSSLDEVFNPRLRRGKKKNLAAAAKRREEAARKLAEQLDHQEVPA